jgi:hypothetical protein
MDMQVHVSCNYVATCLGGSVTITYSNDGVCILMQDNAAAGGPSMAPIQAPPPATVPSIAPGASRFAAPPNAASAATSLAPVAVSLWVSHREDMSRDMALSSLKGLLSLA